MTPNLIDACNILRSDFDRVIGSALTRQPKEVYQRLIDAGWQPGAFDVKEYWAHFPAILVDFEQRNYDYFSHKPARLIIRWDYLYETLPPDDAEVITWTLLEIKALAHYVRLADHFAGLVGEVCRYAARR